MTGTMNIDVPHWPQTVRVEWEREEPADDRCDPRDYLFQDPDHRKSDRKRFNAWTRGDWGFIGVRAKATIYLPIGCGAFTVCKMTSPGVWGIESDSGEDFLAEIFEQEKAGLKAAMLAIGDWARLD